MRIARPVVRNYFVGCEKYSVSFMHLSGRSVLKIRTDRRYGTHLFGRFHQLAVDLYLMFIL